MILRRFRFCDCGVLFRQGLLILVVLVFSASAETAGEQGAAGAPNWNQSLAFVGTQTMKAVGPAASITVARGPGLGQFLVASETLADPRFVETVVLLLQVNEEGAMGVVINRPTQLKLQEVLGDMEGVEDRSDTLFFGGPVGINQIFLLLRTSGPPEESKRILNDVYFSASRDLLQRIIHDGKGEEMVRFLAGYAGWGEGQLDQEILRGDWHVLPGDSETVFQMTPLEMWPALIRRSSYQWVMAVDTGQVR